MIATNYIDFSFLSSFCRRGVTSVRICRCQWQRTHFRAAFHLFSQTPNLNTKITCSQHVYVHHSNTWATSCWDNRWMYWHVCLASAIILITMMACIIPVTQFCLQYVSFNNLSIQSKQTRIVIVCDPDLRLCFVYVNSFKELLFHKSKGELLFDKSVYLEYLFSRAALTNIFCFIVDRIFF